MRQRTVGIRNETAVTLGAYDYRQRATVTDAAGVVIGLVTGDGAHYRASHHGGPWTATHYMGSASASFLTEGAALDWIAYREHDRLHPGPDSTPALAV